MSSKKESFEGIMSEFRIENGNLIYIINLLEEDDSIIAYNTYTNHTEYLSELNLLRDKIIKQKNPSNEVIDGVNYTKLNFA